MKRLLFAFLSPVFCFLVLSSSAQENKQKILDSLFRKTGEIYFTFTIFDRSEIHTLTRIISIDKVSGNEIFAYANWKEFGKFLELDYSYTLLPHPGTLLKESELSMGKAGKGMTTNTVWNFYPTYDQYVVYMQGFASAHPDICRLDTLGFTNQNRLLLAVKISDSVNTFRAKPEFLYTSSMHGDEVTGYIMMMHLIDSLLSGYGTVPRITDFVNNFQIYINPLANPDGTYHGGNNTVNGAWRYNANGIDLNRNYPDPQDGPHPDGNAWQVETMAFMHYDSIHHFVMSANFHGGAEVVNYPWDTWAKLHADDLWFQFISREFADTIHQYSPAGYFTDLDNGITNGYQWYEVNGGRQDYTTYFHLGRETTIELSHTKTPPANQLINYWNYLKRSFLNYIEQSSYGINGCVTDTVTGAPLKARITVLMHDFDNSFENSDTTNGWYFRPINEGTWSLTFSCPGYYMKTIAGVNVTKWTTTRLNVRLVPLNFGIRDKNLSSAFFLYPNPSDGNVRVILPESWNMAFTLIIFDMTGKQVLSTTIDKTSGQISYPLNLMELEKGIYIVKMDTGDRSYENKLVLL